MPIEIPQDYDFKNHRLLFGSEPRKRKEIYVKQDKKILILVENIKNA